VWVSQHLCSLPLPSSCLPSSQFSLQVKLWLPGTGFESAAGLPRTPQALVLTTSRLLLLAVQTCVLFTWNLLKAWRTGYRTGFPGEKMGTARENYSFLSHSAVPAHTAAALFQDHPRTQLVVPESQTNCLPCCSLPNNIVLDKPTPGLPVSWEQNGIHPANSQPTTVLLPECQQHSFGLAKLQKHLVQDNRFYLHRYQHQPRISEAQCHADLPSPAHTLFRILPLASLSGYKSPST